MKTLDQWLNYLEMMDPNKIELGLERIKLVSDKLTLNSFACPVITVTGTNGKGSCVAFLENIFMAAGYRVGAYTSPHLFQFNERIRLNGNAIANEILCVAFELIEKNRDSVSLTYFEFTTLAALQIFREANLDVIILEVGLGGRLDAVNIVDADIAVITTVGIDHSQWLGNDRECIGREKAGIFRRNKLAVCGDNNPPNTVIKIANDLATDFSVAGRDFFYQEMPSDWHWWSDKLNLRNLPLLHLPYQNAATALRVIELLQTRLPVTITAIHKGLQQATLPGRFQKIGQWIFDVAHNPHAAQWLAEKLRQDKGSGRTLAVVGMLKDKDIMGTFNALKEEIEEWYVAGLNGSRGANSHFLMQSLQQIGIKKCYNYALLKEAFIAAQVACEQEDRVVVFGSFYTVGECLLLLSQHAKEKN